MNGSDFLLLILCGALAIYFLPTLIAVRRGHHNGTPIFMLNLFLGWTFLGWVVALIWSFSAIDAGPPPVADSLKYKDRKKCPACAEWIMKDARKCRFCGETLDGYPVVKSRVEPSLSASRLRHARTTED